LKPAPERESYRVVATQPTTTKITTTLPAPDNVFELHGEGDFRTLESLHDFMLTASAGVILADVQVGQEAAGIPRGYPGGDPSLSYVPPIEQWRSDYVLLLPDKYVFDFLVFAVPDGAKVYLDGLLLGPDACDIAPGDGLNGAQRKGAP